jgi:murein DD-endopeptidase MepM/ murein hydrolase activator NlpD
MDQRLRSSFILIVFVAAIAVTPSDLAYGQQTILFGPETFVRSTEAPETIVRSFPVNLPLQDFTIAVQNGEGRHGRVSSAVVRLNGVQLLGPEDFNQRVDLITQAVSLQPQNTLTVELRSAPGRAIVVTVNGRFPTVSGTIPQSGGSINLNGMALITFPNGAFAATNTVRVSVSNSPAVHEDFSATAEGPRLPYEIRINSGSTPPAGAFDVSINVPESFASSVASDHQLEIFAQPLETGTIEALGHFHGFASTFDAGTRTLSATLPAEAFTNESSGDGSYEAILIVADIPKYPPDAGTQGSLRNPHKSAQANTVRLASLDVFALLVEAAPSCEGSPLDSPFDSLVGEPTGRFNPPSHYGVDYGVPIGTDIHPVAPGRVTKIGFDLRNLPKPNPRTGLSVRGWGRYVVITHPDGSQTLYAHMIPDSTSQLVEGVTEVSTTDIIGKAGVSGGVTGPHLHLEYSPEGRIFVKRSLVNPHPCILEGQAPPEPLLVSPQSPTLICGPNSAVSFTATGGRAPYAWSTTRGVITPSADTRTATLRPPISANLSTVAYRRIGQTTAPQQPTLCTGPSLRAALEYNCVDQFIVCDGIPPPPIPANLPFICYNFANFGLACPGIPPCNDNIPLCTLLQDNPGLGVFQDMRSQAIIDQGCRPCSVEMQGGASVTVTDSAGEVVSAAVTVQ